MSNKLKYIGSYAFNDCKKLAYMTLPKSLSYISTDVFTSYTTLNVYKNSVGHKYAKENDLPYKIIK